MDTINQIIKSIFIPILQMVEWTKASGPTVSVGQVVFSFIWIYVWLASGFLAATFSELKGRSRLIHFIGGLVLPYIYPIAIYYLLPSVKEIVLEREEDIDPETGSTIVRKINIPGKSEIFRQKAEEEAAEQAKDEEEEANAEAEGGITQQYMSSIAVDESGAHQGPFILELSDGSYLEVSRITNPLPKLAVLEMIDRNGNSRTIRIPYEKIVSCSLKES